MAGLIAAIVLAAGESGRLGRPKQLLAYRGRTLVRHVVECAAAGGCDPVLVVLGARAREVGHEVEQTAAHAVLNPRWSEGLGSSVRAGVEALQSGWPQAAGVLLLACDQPRITADLVRGLLEQLAEPGRRIVACSYAGTVGVPALFDRSLFPELAALAGPGGAKAVIRSHWAELTRWPWPDGAFDIDVTADVEDLDRP